MSYCKKDGKDTIIFVTQEDHEKPSTVSLSQLEDDDKPAGLVLENGDINWSCPCLGGMATGPCGVEFREAFSCFHYSKVDPKGSDCLEPFRTMSECMSQFPGVYGEKDDENEETLKKNNENEEVIKNDKLADSDCIKNEAKVDKTLSTVVSKSS